MRYVLSDTYFILERIKEILDIELVKEQVVGPFGYFDSVYINETHYVFVDAVNEDENLALKKSLTKLIWFLESMPKQRLFYVLSITQGDKEDELTIWFLRKLYRQYNGRFLFYLRFRREFSHISFPLLKDFYQRFLENKHPLIQ